MMDERVGEISCVNGTFSIRAVPSLPTPVCVITAGTLPPGRLFPVDAKLGWLGHGARVGADTDGDGYRPLDEDGCHGTLSSGQNDHMSRSLCSTPLSRAPLLAAGGTAPLRVRSCKFPLKFIQTGDVPHARQHFPTLTRHI